MKEITEKRIFNSSLYVQSKRNNNNSEKKLVLNGLAATFNEETILYSDSEFELREIILPEAFNECDLSDVILVYNHDGHLYARTRNNSLYLFITSKGLEIKAFLDSTNPRHLELYNDVSTKLLDKMSFAFTVEDQESSYRKIGNKAIELVTIKKIRKVFDVSIVDFPAYKGTNISTFEEYQRKEKLELDKRKTLILLGL